MFHDHHRACADVPRRGAQVFIQCCATCGGWHVSAERWTQDGDHARVLRSVEVALGPFDDVPEVLRVALSLLEQLGLAALTPWAVQAADGDA